MTNSHFASWNFLQFFFSNIINLRLVESMESEPKDMEEQLYSTQVLPIKSRWPSCFGELSSADLV